MCVCNIEYKLSIYRINAYHGDHLLKVHHLPKLCKCNLCTNYPFFVTIGNPKKMCNMIYNRLSKFM